MEISRCPVTTTPAQTKPWRGAVMIQAAALLETHRRPGPLDRKLLVECIEACVSCAQSCTACADADLAEDDVTKMRRCIRLCLDCADVCEATGRVLTRQTEFDAPTA